MADEPAKAGWLTCRDDVAAMLDELLDGRPDVRRGKMMGLPAYYTGRKMFAFVMGDGISLKLPEERISALVEMPGFSRCTPMERTMSGWLQIDRADAGDYRQDLPLIEDALAFVAAQAAAPARTRKGRSR